MQIFEHNNLLKNKYLQISQKPKYIPQFLSCNGFLRVIYS